MSTAPFESFCCFRPSATPLATAFVSVTASLVAFAVSWRMVSGLGFVWLQPTRTEQSNSPEKNHASYPFRCLWVRLASCETLRINLPATFRALSSSPTNRAAHVAQRKQSLKFPNARLPRFPAPVRNVHQKSRSKEQQQKANIGLDDDVQKNSHAETDHGALLLSSSIGSFAPRVKGESAESLGNHITSYRTGQTGSTRGQNGRGRPRSLKAGLIRTLRLVY